MVILRCLPRLFFTRDFFKYNKTFIKICYKCFDLKLIVFGLKLNDMILKLVNKFSPKDLLQIIFITTNMCKFIKQLQFGCCVMLSHLGSNTFHLRRSKISDVAVTNC